MRTIRRLNLASSIMTIREAAQYLKLNYMTIYKLAQQGKIPASKIGGNWRLKKELLDEWIAESSRAFLGKVLIVAVEPELRENLKEAIKERGYKVAAVSSEEKANIEMDKNRYDMVILDTGLQNDGAVSVIKAMREKGDETNCALIFKKGEELPIKDAAALGPVLLLKKDFDDKAINQLVKMIGPRR